LQRAFSQFSGAEKADSQKVEGPSGTLLAAWNFGDLRDAHRVEGNVLMLVGPEQQDTQRLKTECQLAQKLNT
jgi:hypothetical protein